MFFECRAQPAANVPSVAPPSDLYREVAGAFAAGRTHAARQALAALDRAALKPQQASDYILAADVLRGGGEKVRALRRLASGRREFPDDADLLKAWLYEVSGYRHLNRHLNLLEDLRHRTPERERGAIDALTAVSWARAGFARRAADARDRALAGGLRQSLVVICLAEVEMRLHRYDEAVEFAHRAVQQADRWPRARGILAEALLARCRLEEATRSLWTLLPPSRGSWEKTSEQRYVEDAPLEEQLGWTLFQGGDHSAALPYLWRARHGWPERRLFAVERPRLVLAALPWQLAEIPAELVALATHQDPAAWAELEPQLVGRSSSRRQVSVPAIRVEREGAWAATIAMAACAQGVVIEPRALGDAAPPRDRLPLWRLVDILLDRHFRVEAVAADAEYLCALLDQRVAPIGMVAGWPHPHLEILLGYDRERRVFLARNPAAPKPHTVAWAEVGDRYATLGGLLAAMAPLRAFEVALPPGARLTPMTALFEVERAAALGERERLERALVALPETHPCGVRRELAGVGVAFGPREMARRLAALAQDTRLPPYSRQLAAWHLMTSVLGRPAASPSQRLPDGDGGAPWLDPAAVEPTLAAFFAPPATAVEKRLGRLLRAVAGRNAAAGARRAEALSERWPGIGIYWRLQAQSAAWLGDAERARWCGHQTLELTPDDVQALTLLRRLQVVPAPAFEAIGELRKLVEVFPYDPWLKLELVTALADQVDGVLYERSLLEALRFLPRWPSAWWMLVRWYELQGRLDLARSVRERSRLWLTAEELETEPSLDPSWWRRASVVGQQVGRAIRQNDLVGARLPPTLAGPVQASLIAFLEALSPLHLDVVFAGAVAAWVERQVDGQMLWPALDGLLGLLEETQGLHPQALRRYQRLHREQPGYSLAWQRHGALVERRDAAASLEANRRALASRPAEVACHQALARLEHALGHHDHELRAREALCRLLPYAFAPLEELAMATLQYKGLAAALALLEDRRSQHGQGDLAALRAWLRAEAGEFAAASEEMSQFPEARRARPLLVTLAELRVAEANADYRRASALIEEGRELAPDHPVLMAALARDLERRNPAKRLEFLRDALRHGFPEPRFLRDFFAAHPENEWVEVALALLDDTDPPHRASLANQMAVLLGEKGELESRANFLREALVRIPDDADLLEHATQTAIDAGQKEEAVAFARRLFEVESDTTRAIGLLAACLRDIAPREAHRFLLLEYEKTLSLDCLAQVADSYRRLGETSQALETWHQVLDREREHPKALIALFELGERSPALANGLLSLVARGRGFDHPMIHVAAVEMAISENQSLPENWLEGAQRRFDKLRRAAHPETDDERLRLGLAIAKWLQHAGRKDEAKAIRQAAGSTWRRLRWLDWPTGKRWIPVTEELDRE